MKHYTADELRGLPTLEEGQADNLKISTPFERVWLSRVGVADGMPCDDQVTIEWYDETKGVWRERVRYQG